ncbi:MAG TPA: hypothetical protein VNL77_12095 [Roseiflexaceae bacterium]|nr:hypothetical protein [Roseiflexaceae bacterium]
MSEQPHEMQLVQTHPSGAEEWYCPTCGRRFLMHWPPSYKKIVLEPGDEYAAHVGGKGGIRMGAPAISPEAQPAETGLFAAPAEEFAGSSAATPLPVEELGPVPITDELRPWLRYLSEAGLDEQWGK